MRDLKPSTETPRPKFDHHRILSTQARSLTWLKMGAFRALRTSVTLVKIDEALAVYVFQAGEKQLHNSY